MSYVLLVEPDAVLARTYKEALQYYGFTVHWVRSAQTAIHAIDQATPRLVVLELQLPKNNGVEFLYELRSYPEWEELPVVILSSAPQVSEGALQKLGVVDYLYKPETSLQHLVQVVDHHATLKVP